MQSYTRHKLKEDRFAEATKEAVHWSVEHRNTLIVVAVIVAVALGAVLVGSLWLRSKDEKASLALANAMRTYSTPVREPGAPADPNTQSFTSATERAQAAHKQFLEIAEKHSWTKNGKYARYMAGVTAVQLGDASKGEQLLQEVAGYSKDLAALGKFGLASLYRVQGKTGAASRLYTELADSGAATVPYSTAQLEHAEMLAEKDPSRAIKIYEEIQKREEAERKELAGKDGAKAPQDGKTAIEELALQKSNELKAKAGK